MESKIRKQIESDIKDSYMGYGDFRDSIAVDLLTESFKKSVLSFSTFLRKNYSTQERWENIQLESDSWRDYDTDVEYTTEELYDKFIEIYERNNTL